MPDPHHFTEFIERHSIHTMRVVLPDINGTARGKIVPAAKFLKSADDGIRFARSVLVQDIEGENAPVPGFDAASGDADLLGIPDPDTLCLCPWKPGTAQVILEACDPETRKPLKQSCRTALRSAVKRLDHPQFGYSAMVASELEFYVFEPGGRTIGAGSPAYSMVSLARLQPLVDDLMRATEVIGLEAEACLHEYAPGQLEINVAPSDPLAMADRTFLFRGMVKEMAIAAGLEATFMAKPLAGHSGSGYHVHVSLWKDGANAFWDPDAAWGPTGASDLLGSFISGQQEHAHALYALCAPTVNSYRRAALGDYVPTRTTWGGDDRTVAFRIPPPGPRSARVEHRIAGADANPYLLIAGILHTGFEGIMDGLHPPKREHQSRGPFPSTLPEALSVFEAGAFIRSAFDPELREVFLTVKRQEWRKFMAQITDWERTVYGNAL